MDSIRHEASDILALKNVHSEYVFPPRLVFSSPKPDSGISTAFTHLYAGIYQSGSVIETWLSPNAAQDELGSVAATRDLEMGEAPTASLQVTVVPRDREKQHIIHMDRTVFLSLFNDLMLDDYALYLYLTNVPGLHFLGRKTSQAGSSEALGFYLNTLDYTFIWSYNPGTKAINVILLGEADAKWTTNGLVQAMWAKQHIIFNPLYLAFVACFQGFLGIWECDSGFRPKAELSVKTMELDIDSTEGLRHFSEACMWFGKSLTYSERSLRRLRTLQEIAAQLDQTQAGTSVWDEIRGVTGGNDDILQRSTSEIQAAMPSLRSQLASRIAHFEWEMRCADVNLRMVKPMGRSQQKGSGVQFCRADMDVDRQPRACNGPRRASPTATARPWSRLPTSPWCSSRPPSWRPCLTWSRQRS
jgi:hypothetical protein